MKRSITLGIVPGTLLGIGLGLAALCIGAGGAQAAEPNRAYAFLAGQHLGEEVMENVTPAVGVDPVEVEFNLTGGSFGVGYQLLPQVAIEVSGSYWHGEWRGETKDSPTFRERDLTGYSAQGSMLLFPFSDADTRYNPFLKLGGGHLWLDLDLPMDWKAVFGNAGLGLEYRVSRSFSWSLQGDYHRFYESGDLDSGLDDGWSVTFALKYLL